MTLYSGIDKQSWSLRRVQLPEDQFSRQIFCFPIALRCLDVDGCVQQVRMDPLGDHVAGQLDVHRSAEDMARLQHSIDLSGRCAHIHQVRLRDCHSFGHVGEDIEVAIAELGICQGTCRVYFCALRTYRVM